MTFDIQKPEPKSMSPREAFDTGADGFIVPGDNPKYVYFFTSVGEEGVSYYDPTSKAITVLRDSRVAVIPGKPPYSILPVKITVKAEVIWK